MSLDLLSYLDLLGIIGLLLEIDTVLFSNLLSCKLVLIVGVFLGVLFLDLLVLSSLGLILLLLLGLLLLLSSLLLSSSFLLFLILIVLSFLGSLLSAFGLLLLGRSWAASLCGSGGGLGLGRSLDGLSGILLLGLALSGYLGYLILLVLGALLVICGLAISSLNLLFFLNLLGIGIGLLLFDCFLSLIFGFLAFSFNSVLLFLRFLF